MSTSFSVGIPPSTSSSSFPPSFSYSELITSIHSLYTLLTKLPYIPPSALVSPPAEGWPGVDASALRARGKTEEVIDLLRHLPYLREPEQGQRWMIGPDTVGIAYCDGMVYAEVMDEIQPVPGHCIWLTEGASRDGTELLLDTKTGTITEHTTMEHRIMIDYEEYDRIPTPDKWMAHPTMEATTFIRLWKRRFERLIWMPLYDSRRGTAQWYITARTREDEEDMLASDEDFKPSDEEDDGDDDFDSADKDDDDADEKSRNETESEGEDKDDGISNSDTQIPTGEVDNLMDDAYGKEEKEAWKRRMDLQSQSQSQEEDAATVETKPMHPPPSKPVDQRQPQWQIDMDRKTQEVYRIYIHNGWPEGFDRETCRIALAEFLEREEGSSPIKRS